MTKVWLCHAEVHGTFGRRCTTEPPSAEEAAKTKEERVEAFVDVAALQRADQRIALEREAVCQQLHDDELAAKKEIVAIIHTAIQLFVQNEALEPKEQAQRLAHLHSYIQHNKSSMDIPWLDEHLWYEYLDETMFQRQQMQCPFAQRQSLYDDLAIREIYWNDEVTAARKAFESSQPQPSEPTAKAAYTCNICSASFLSMSTLHQHLPECQQQRRQPQREQQQQERDLLHAQRKKENQEQRNQQKRERGQQYQRRQQQSDERYTQRQQQFDELQYLNSEYLNSESAEQIQQFRQARLELVMAIASSPTPPYPMTSSPYSTPTHPPKPRTCTRCDKSFPSSTALHKHLQDCRQSKTYPNWRKYRDGADIKSQDTGTTRA